jgi:hypothetical protein
MKGMQKISRGNGFGGVLAYAAEGENHIPGHGNLIGGNMAGTNPESLAREFRAVALQRPDIQKPVWHNALRLPKGEDITNEKWDEIARDYMQKMGWDLEKTQYCVWKHDEEHIHIIANRVLLNSKVFLGQNENLISTKMIAELEKQYGLTITPGVKLDEAGKIIMPEQSKPKKREIEKALRTGVRPPRLVLQDLVKDAWRGKPTTIEFMERLEAAGVEVLPNVAATGTMNGFSFRLDGLKFSGSELGTIYKWAKLQEKIDYDQARDGEELAQRRDAEKRRADDERSAKAASELALGVADRGFADSDAALASSDTADNEPARDDSAVSRSDRAPGASTAGGVVDAEENQQAHGLDGKESSADRELGQASSDDRKSGAASSGRPADNDSVGGLRKRGLQGSDVEEVAHAIIEIAKPAEAKDVRAKRLAWAQQHKALQAPFYRLTMVDRVCRDGIDRTHNIGKARIKGDPETFYTAQQVEGMMPTLRAKNARGFEIYLTPMDDAYHHIVIDDLTPEKLAALRAAGYTPALVQASSANNSQAIIRTEKVARSDEQQIANKLVVDLNKTYGDPLFSGVIHPMRMAGFSNKKPGRANAFTRVVEALGAVCDKARQLLASFREQVDSQAAAQVQRPIIAQRAKRITSPELFDVAGLGRAYQDYAHHMTSGRAEIDWSKVDFGVSCEMMKAGYDPDDVKKALHMASPSVSTRHSDVHRYVNETVDHAKEKINYVPGMGKKKLEIKLD